jgi:transmembrane sensor
MKRSIEKGELLVKYLDGSATAEEIEMILEWKNESTLNKKEFERIVAVWEMATRLSEMKKIDVARARNEVRKQIKEFNKKDKKLWHYWRNIAAILFLPLIISLSVYIFKTRHPMHLRPANQLEIYSACGLRTKFSLPDGTTVWLNSGSKITYPEKFSDGKREVQLHGEALFEVKKNEKWPFYVNLGELSVKAVGTSFSVTAYPEEDIFETTLITGSIHLVKQDKQHHEIVLREMMPNQHAVYSKAAKEIQLSESIPVQDANSGNGHEPNTVIQSENNSKESIYARNKYTAWVEGKLIFHDDPMVEVVRRLGRWYNVDIVLKDTILYDFRYTATFTDETLVQVMDLLVLSAPLKYEISTRKENADNTFSKEIVNLYLNIPDR